MQLDGRCAPDDLLQQAEDEFVTAAAVADGDRTRTTQAVGGPRGSDTPTDTAWAVTGSFVLTGEATSDRGVVPSQPFPSL